MSVNSRPDYTGTFYWFAGRKRAEDSTCQGEVKPGTLVLADGTTKYDVVGLDDAEVDELVSIPIPCLLRLAGPSHHHISTTRIYRSHALIDHFTQACYCWFWSLSRRHPGGVPGATQVRQERKGSQIQWDGRLACHG